MDNHIIGQRIVDGRKLTKSELKRHDWPTNTHHGPAIALILENGAVLYPSRDPEGNGSGTFFYARGKNAKRFYTIYEFEKAQA